MARGTGSDGAALVRQLDRWMLSHEEKPPGRFVVRDGAGRWLSLVAEDGAWRWTSKKGQGVVADDGALEALLERVFAE